MLLFAGLVGTALYFRNRLEIHKRLMLIAAVNFLAPAIARIPLDFIATGGSLAFFGLTDLCLLACVAYDTVKHKRLHPAFLWGTLVVIASQPLRLLLAGTQVWTKFASWLVSLYNRNEVLRSSGNLHAEIFRFSSRYQCRWTHREDGRLRELFESLGFVNVETFIASGNVIFKTNQKTPKL